MASQRTFVDSVLDLWSGPGELRAQAMFGEFGVYLDDKLVGLICDDQFFLKPTEATREVCPEAKLESPYPGAKPCLVLEAELEDPELFAQLLQLTYAKLPAKKQKAKKKG